jgi:hypothetical protein
MNAVYEVVLLFRSKSVTDNRHLAMGRKLHGTGQAASLYRSVADTFENTSAHVLKVFVSRYKQDCFGHKELFRAQGIALLSCTLSL